MDELSSTNFKENTLALGAYPTVSLEQARLKRDAFKKLLVESINPAEERNNSRNQAKAKLENTFGKYATAWINKALISEFMM